MFLSNKGGLNPDVYSSRGLCTDGLRFTDIDNIKISTILFGLSLPLYSPQRPLH